MLISGVALSAGNFNDPSRNSAGWLNVTSDSALKNISDEEIPRNPYVFPPSFGMDDWRAFENGDPVVGLTGGTLPEGYGYMEGFSTYKVTDKVHLRTLTVARSREGHPSQHIIIRRSTDGGQTWSDWFELEPEGPPLTTYGSFFRHPTTDQVYFMYFRGPDEDMHYSKEPTDFLDIATFLGWHEGEPFRCYPHLVGKVMFRYVSKEGEFSERYELPVPVADIDRSTLFKGKYFVSWSYPIPHRMMGDDGLTWITKHGPIPRCGNGEAFFLLFKNYANNDRLETLEIELLPNDKRGITHLEYSSAGGFSPLIMEDDHWCFHHRTVYGFIGLARSNDQGQTWKTDILRYSPDGRPVKSPQGPYGFPSDPKGRKFFVYYNNSVQGFDDFSGRDLVYIAYMETRNNQFYFSEPELVHYRKDQLGYDNHSHERLNTPEFGAGPDGIIGRISDKEYVKTFPVPEPFFDLLSQQFKISGVPETGLLIHLAKPKSKIPAPILPSPGENGGFSICFRLLPQPEAAKGKTTGTIVLIDAFHNKKGVKAELTADHTLVFTMSDGKETVTLTSNENILNPSKTHDISIIVDGYPKLVSIVINGEFQDGGKTKERGTVWFSHDFGDANGASTWQLANKQMTNLRIYDRFLMTTEVVGLYRASN